jgi:NAD(P)-dependent dehydrogenase (short-subunit alcohol dehydrogenase family)
MTNERVCVVTGASGAVGLELVRQLSGCGYRVASVDRAASNEAAGIHERADGTLAATLDVGSTQAWGAVVPQIEQRLGPVGAAVLVAGGWRGGKALHEAGDDVWRAMLDSNLETARAAMVALLPGMVARGAGSIVLFGSRAAERPWESANAAAYVAAKSAVVALAKAVSAEVVHRGVRVNAVLPSTIDTAANRAAMPTANHEDWVSTASIAGVVQFLLSDAARDVSGAAIPVYGRA